MKYTIPLLTCLFLTTCGMILNVEKVYQENTVSVFTNVDSALSGKNERLVFLIFYEKDSNLYNSPITKILQLDTTRDDALNYKSLCDYGVVKLYRSEYESFLNSWVPKDSLDSLKQEGIAYDPGKAFMFVCYRDRPCLYGEQTLDSPKAEIHDLLWVFMGP